MAFSTTLISRLRITQHFIQTGHSNCESNDQERKISSNTIYYLKQRTQDNFAEDLSSQDIKAPNINEVKYDSLNDAAKIINEDIESISY